MDHQGLQIAPLSSIQLLINREDVPQQLHQFGRGMAIFERPGHWPESPVQFAKNKLVFDGPVTTTCLLRLPDENCRSKYDGFFKDVRQSVHSSPTIKIQASGQTESSIDNAMDSFDEVLLLRHSSMESLATALVLEWWDILVAAHEMQSIMSDSAQLIVQEIRMPDKVKKLDIYRSAWDCGNPFGRPGQDFFG